MSFWGPKPDECDFAFDSIGAAIYKLKEQLMNDIKTGLEHPEQSMVALLCCLRLIGERFPKNLSVSFGREDYLFVANAFEEWLAKSGPRLPKKYREKIEAEARAEFALFEERILNRPSKFKRSGS